jgi:hypothetical protein
MTRAAAHAPEFMPGTAAESFETRLIHPATLSIFKFPAKNFFGGMKSGATSGRRRPRRCRHPSYSELSQGDTVLTACEHRP